VTLIKGSSLLSEHWSCSKAVYLNHTGSGQPWEVGGEGADDQTICVPRTPGALAGYITLRAVFTRSGLNRVLLMIGTDWEGNVAADSCEPKGHDSLSALEKDANRQMPSARKELPDALQQLFLARWRRRWFDLGIKNEQQITESGQVVHAMAIDLRWTEETSAVI